MLVTGAAGLEVWCRRVTGGYAGVRIVNMTESWRDGLAFCAIIHRFRPQLLDYASLEAGCVRRNCELAFSVAEKHLGIPSLLDPQDMLESLQLDKLSILTYVSQFYHKFSKESPTPATRRSIMSGSSMNDFNLIRVGYSDAANTSTDSDYDTTTSIITVAPPSPDSGGEMSSLSPYSSSSSSGCYQVTNPNEAETESKSKVSIEALSKLPELSNDSGVTCGNTDDRNRDTATNIECSNKSSNSENILVSSTYNLNAKKPQADQTSTDFTNSSAGGTSVFNSRQIAVISPTPSSSSSKTSFANELMCLASTASDSGLEISSEMSSTSSPSSSRLSSVSPSSEKMNRNILLPVKASKVFIQRKSNQKMSSSSEISSKENLMQNGHTTRKMNAKRSGHSNSTSDVKDSSAAPDSVELDSAELDTKNQLTFRAALTKFNSLSPVSGKLGYKAVQLRSQSSQTDSSHVQPPAQLVSQLCQTEESHLSFANQIPRSRTRQIEPGQKPREIQNTNIRHTNCGGAQDMRRNTLLRQMSGTNVFYQSAYNLQPYSPTHYKNNNFGQHQHSPGLQSTLV